MVVEIDPHDPDSTPRRRTALGRFKHEAAEPRLTRDDRAVLYMGDDERFDYFYKFVSKERMRHGDGPAAREHNPRLLDEGTLYVAKFTTYFAGFPKDHVSPISCPDNIAFDPYGNHWLAPPTATSSAATTDCSTSRCVGGAKVVKQFLTVPRGAEAVGR